jgi:hypothetical protein
MGFSRRSPRGQPRSDRAPTTSTVATERRIPGGHLEELTMRPTRILATTAAILGLAVAACGGTAGGVGQQAPAATVAPSAAIVGPYPDVVMPEPLRGTWIANVQRPGPSTGLWRLRISEHAMELKNPGSASDTDFFWVMTDKIDGSSFHVASDDGCPAVSYAYTITGDELVMTTTRAQPSTTDDTCGDPVVIFTTPFKRDS